MSKFKQASLILEKNYSVALKINLRVKNNSINIKRHNSGKNVDKPVAEAPKGIAYKNLTIGIARETFMNEKRVAVTPVVAQNLVKKGFKVLVEENAGTLAKFPNEQYEQAGAKIVRSVYAASDILLKVRPPEVDVNLIQILLMNPAKNPKSYLEL